jgi:hypothetical protein
MRLIEKLKDQEAIFDAAQQLESLSTQRRRFDRNTSSRTFERDITDELKEAIIQNLHKKLSLIYLSYEHEDD